MRTTPRNLSLPPTLLPLTLGLGLLAGCPNRTISELDPGQSGVLTKEIPLERNIDLLFVIDNSGSTADKQAQFTTNFQSFIDAINTSFGSGAGAANLHIGVVDTTVDLGTNAFAGGGGCPGTGTDNGILKVGLTSATCPRPDNGALFITSGVNPDGTDASNYGSDSLLADVFTCDATLGTSGCGFEMPLEAMKRALDGTQAGPNAGFIRSDADLAVVILTDEDDASTKGSDVFNLPNATYGDSDFRVQPYFAYKCDTQMSLTTGGTYDHCAPRVGSGSQDYLQDPAYYAQFLTTLKDPSQIVVAVIAGNPPSFTTNDPTPITTTASTVSTSVFQVTPNDADDLKLDPAEGCTDFLSDHAIARPGIRLASFVQNFGIRGRYYSICQNDYSAALRDIGLTLFNAVSPCLEGDVDTLDIDQNNPGVQLDCTVSQVHDKDAADQTSSVVPACPMSDATTPAANGPRPCWWSPMDATTCPPPDSGYEVQIEGTLDTDATEVVQCATALN